MVKSEPKKNMEKSILEAVYWMGVESLDPESFEYLENIILQLHENRNLGVLQQPDVQGSEDDVSK